MKGSLHTRELIHEVIAGDTGLATERRVSHVFVMDVPTYPRPLFITDAAIRYLAEAQGAGIVLGARIPIILTSRADTVLARMASCAVALVAARRGRLSAP